MGKKFNIGVIRVLTVDEDYEMALHGRLLEEYFPVFNTDSYCIQDQYNGIHNKETHEEALPKIISLAHEIYGDYDGIIISCAGDPAVDKLRTQVSIPITGAGLPTAAHSLNFGEKIGVLGIEDSPPENYQKVLQERLIKYLKPEHVNNTNDLQTDRGKDSLLDAARKLKREVDVITLACTGMSTIGIASFLEKELNIPVIDPVIAEGLFMYERLLSTETK